MPPPTITSSAIIAPKREVEWLASRLYLIHTPAQPRGSRAGARRTRHARARGKIGLPATSCPRTRASRERRPHRGIAIFIAGLSPSVWLIDIVAALTQGHTPQSLASYMTDITTMLDVGIITPAAFLVVVRTRGIDYSRGLHYTKTAFG